MGLSRLSSPSILGKLLVLIYSNLIYDSSIWIALSFFSAFFHSQFPTSNLDARDADVSVYYNTKPFYLTFSVKMFDLSLRVL